MELPIELSAAPWSLLMAIASLGIIYLLFRSRSDVFEELGFSGKEVALLCLGSIAGWAVNLPLARVGGTYLAVNVGGTLVPILLIAWWIRKGKLRILPAIIGTAIVSVVAWRIVKFVPEAGIIARYPDFFLPVAAALIFGLVVSVRRIGTSVPIAYTSGTLGALIGADLMHVADIRAHFLTAKENTIISIGGAGVFDMVFLAGSFAMALNLAIVVPVIARKPKTAKLDAYPPRPVSLEDSALVYRRYQALANPNPLERAYAGIALSDLALREGDFGKSVRMSWLAVDSILRDDQIRQHMANGVDKTLRSDITTLHQQSLDARTDSQSLKQAGEANIAAKTLIAALAPRTGLTITLEGSR